MEILTNQIYKYSMTELTEHLKITMVIHHINRINDKHI